MQTAQILPSQGYNVTSYLMILLHNIPYLLTNIYIVPDWMEFAVLTFCFNILHLQYLVLIEKTLNQY
jgi:hypothetical protein